MDYRSTISRASDRGRDVPSFIEPRPPSILNPFMRPKPQKGTNLLELFEEDSIEDEAPELVQVYLRLKPSKVKSSLYEVRSDQCLITTLDTATAGHGRRTQHNVSKMYKFSHIFGDDANQKDIFDHVVKHNLRKLPDGHNFTLLTYGASGSGKTYTLMGTVKAPGLVPRALEYVFQIVDAAQSPLYHPGENGAYKLSSTEQEHELQWVRQLRLVSAPLRDKYRRMSMKLGGELSKSTLDLSVRTKHYVWVSFVEIYNEAIYDLLTTAERTAASKLRIREDASGNAFVKGAAQAFVRSGEEAYDVLVAGKHNLQVHATGVHARSSRSHCIFTVTMLTETECGVRASCVRLCDLAGSERARRTRNTGARMQESRAINTSLHVLERCLHTLRRRQARAHDMVPYRESKLTRLLGAGLSGTRGEAVSMVVTLNPAPEFAHETRHVLQLTTVARDIQVNNTIAESISMSTLDSSSADSTATGAELMALRAENERLHYELLQCESLNAKLLADMASRQQQSALTLQELVAEARDIEVQYYGDQLRRLRERHAAEIAELREEYEIRLEEEARSVEEGMPALQKKNVDLMQRIAILEEKLSAEKLAKARMNEELQHLRACIEERDEKASDDNSNEDAIELTDSEGESDSEDLCNESLEPTLKKEDINRSRLIRQSTINSTHNTTNGLSKTKELKDDSVVDRKSIISDRRDSTVDENDTSERNDETYDVSNSDSCDRSTDCPDTVKKANFKIEKEYTDVSTEGTLFVESKDASKHNVRETYFISDSNLSVNGSKRNSFEGNDTVQSDDTGINVSVKDGNDTSDLKDSSVCVEKPIKCVLTQVDKLKQFANNTVSSDSSLTQFESLEQEANDYEIVEKQAFKYFEGGSGSVADIINPRKIKEKKQYFDNIEPSAKFDKIKDFVKKHDILRSPSIVQDDIPEDYEPTTINKIMRQSFTKNADVAPACDKSKLLLTKHDSLDLFDESPCYKVDVLKSVEAARKAIENIALVVEQDEIPTEAEMIEKETEVTIEATSKNKNSPHIIDVNIDLEIPSVPIEDQPAEEKQLNVSTDIKNVSEHEIVIEDQVKLEPNMKTKIMNVQEQPEMNSVTIKQERIGTEVLANDQEAIKNGELRNTEISNTTTHPSSQENTIDAFEDIYKDVTVPRVTDFELLVSQISEDKSNETATLNKNDEAESKNDKESEDTAKAYNLRNKTVAKDSETDEELVKNTAKSAPKMVRKNLRLRKQKTKVDEDAKFKDIVNLQKEFSDVTLDVPAPVKVVNDIQSPEKSETENMPPLMGIQSCPSKSVTRSRRKLFTPRAEPLEESPAAAGASAERVRVPRPSYHRPRTRRRLN